MFRRTLNNTRIVCWLPQSLAVLLLVGSTASANDRETPIVTAVRHAAPAVVNIHGQKTVRSNSGNSGNDLRQVNGMGTAVVVDPSGYLITNYHVIEDVSDIRATLDDGRAVTARVVASDRRTDLAVLKIDVGSPLPVIDVGTSSDLMLGETVLAIGNAYGYEHTVTTGIISALHRDVPVNDEIEYRDLIQVDAAINPGNSGGPLLNVEGRMIGVNVAVRVGAQSIAFAIPVDNAMEIVSEIVERQASRRVRLAVRGRSEFDAGRRRFVVESVSPEGEAAGLGLEPGDHVVRAGERAIRSRLDFAFAMLDATPGEPLDLEVDRGDRAVQLVMKLDGSAAPSETAASQRIWSVLGLQVEPVSASAVMRELSAPATEYRGGLRVRKVREGSTAARRGIAADDILVGIHQWQTTSESELDYILRSSELRRAQRLFYIIRKGQTLEGSLQVAASTASSRRSTAR